jgi:tRNA(Ile)-lysidine synthase
MHKFVRSLITEWRRIDLPLKDASIVVAVSGGADSMSLLAGIHELADRKKLDLRVVVAHLDHRLRGAESDEDAEFVRRYALDCGFEFETASKELARKGNLEQNARDARYKFLTKVAKRYNATVVLTGHTLNDQAETVLINLVRGSGLVGLSGMRQKRELSDGVSLVRPLLAWARREQTEEFCREKSIAFRRDSMNEDPSFTRVRLRKSIIPALAELNPRIIESLARTADLIGHSNGGSGAARPATIDHDLKLLSLRRLSKPELYSVLRAWLREFRGNLRSIDLKHIQAIERLIHSPKSGRTVELPGRGVVVKTGGSLVFTNLKVEK